MPAYIIARLTFQEAARRRILLAALVLGLLFLVVFALGFNYIVQDVRTNSEAGSILMENEVFNFITLAGLYVVNFLTIMLTVLTSVDTLSGEISTGTIQTMVTKPLRRWEIVLGKLLGFTVLMTLYVLLMAGGVAGLVSWISGYAMPNLWSGMFLIWMNGLLMLCVSLLGGTFLSTLANGVLVFGMFGVAFVGGWIEQIGSFMENEAAINVGIISSLLMPSEALWKRAAYEMRSPLVAQVGFSPFTSASSIPSPEMVIYAGFYMLAAVWAAMLVFGRRDI